MKGMFDGWLRFLWAMAIILVIAMISGCIHTPSKDVVTGAKNVMTVVDSVQILSGSF